jgi:DNA-binding LacI/PurR family transcriptional regulator
LQSQLFVPEAERLPLLALSEENSEPTPVVEWFRRHQPDAILTDVACLAGQLESAGLRVPTDVGLVALSVLDGGVGAGIDQNAVEVGRIAAEALIAQLQCFIPATPDSCRQIFVEPRWVDGASLPRIQTSGDAR